MTCYVPLDSHNVISTLKVHQPFKVVKVTEIVFIDLKKYAGTFLGMINLHIYVKVYVDSI